MKNILLLLLNMYCLCTYSQTEMEIQKALKTCDYEVPINRIAPIIGDTLLTPLRAQALEAMNLYPEAVKEWNSLLKSDSTNVDVLMQLARCYRTTGRGQQAVLCYRKATDLFPNNQFFRQQYIRSLLAVEDYAEACDVCRDWIDCDSTSAVAYQLLGMTYEGIAIEYPDSLDDACTAYQSAYHYNPSDGQTVAHLAALLNDFELYEEAIEITENYRRADTTDVNINRQNAKAYCMLKDYDMSISRHEALKAMNDKSFTTYYYLGVSHYWKKDYWEAHDNLLKAHNKRPFDVNTLYYLAKASVISSWKEEGMEYMKDAIDLVTPNDSLLIRLYKGLVDSQQIVPKDDPYQRIEVIKKLYALNKDYKLFYRIAYIYERETKDEVNAYYYHKKYIDMANKNGALLVDNNGYPKSGIFSQEVLNQEYSLRFIKNMREKEFFEKGKENK